MLIESGGIKMPGNPIKLLIIATHSSLALVLRVNSNSILKLKQVMSG